MNTLRASLTTLCTIAALLAGCQSTRTKSGSTTAPSGLSEQELAIRDAHRRQALIETIRVLEIQLADADGEVGRLQNTMSQGGAFLEAYNEAFQKREELRNRLDDARMQLQSIPD